MKLMTRYILSELMKVFLVALTGLTLFMLIVGVMQQALQQGLGFKQVLLLIRISCPMRCGLRSRHSVVDRVQCLWAVVGLQ